MKKRVDPKRVIRATITIFAGVLGKHALRNVILSVIAIALSPKMRINEISRHLPIGVDDKHKQKRFLRFLKRGLPFGKAKREWCKYVLRQVYSQKKRGVIIVDITKLIGPFKAIVAAIPYRKRAIPIYWIIFSDDQIRNLQYLSQNQIVDIFIKELSEILEEALGKKKSKKMIWVFDRGFADVKLMERYKEKIVYLIRIKRDVWVEIQGKYRYCGKVGGFKKRGLFSDVVYHKEKRLRLHLYCDPQEEDPFYVVSNQLFALQLIYRLRMQIEQCFRDLKSLFGFKYLVLRIVDQDRVEMLFCLVVMSMGLLLLKYEKSGYRWMRELSKKKMYSLVRVIKRVVRDSWSGFKLEGYFSLSEACY